MIAAVRHALSMLFHAPVSDRETLKRKTLGLIWHDQALMAGLRR